MLLFVTTVAPLLAILPLYGTRNVERAHAQSVGIGLGVFAITLYFWIIFDELEARPQLGTDSPFPGFVWNHVGLGPGYHVFMPPFVHMGVDGLSLFFIVLTAFLVPFCVAFGERSIVSGSRAFAALLFLMESLLLVAFSALDLLTFYAFFEGTIMPMFLIIGIWGSRSRKIKAALYLVYYTLVGSAFMLGAIIYLHSSIGSSSIYGMLLYGMSERERVILWFLFFLGFGFKVPILPFHIWLPEAHVEAPTPGSVMLAGILLKLGGYGLLRFVVPIFPGAGIYFYPLLLVIGSLSIIYPSLCALRQVDLKKIIAYSSVAHMNLGLLGVFSANTQGVMGSLVLLIGHGLVSSALFFLIGVLYDRHHSRMLRHFSGLTQVMPVFALCFLYFSLANMGLPGTSNFVGEALIIVGLFRVSALAATIGAIGTVLCAGYSLWLHNRINMGTLLWAHERGRIFTDLTLLEVGIFILFGGLSLILGLYPFPVLRVLALPCAAVL